MTIGTLRALQFLCGILITLAVPTGWWLIAQPLSRPATPVPSVRVETADTAVAGPPLDSIILAASARAPFQPSRRQASVRFDARRVLPSTPPPPPPPRPQLALTGIVWGQDPAAVVEGLPGIEGGKLVRKGEQVNGITIRRVARNHIEASGFDTLWTLTVREAWR
jgi:hypothetical protein